MYKINLQEIKTGDQIIMYDSDPVIMDWVIATIKQIGLNYILLEDSVGNTWKEDLTTIQNPEHYRVYDPPPPEPPKKKPFMYRLLKKWGWT